MSNFPKIEFSSRAFSFLPDIDTFDHKWHEIVNISNSVDINEKHKIPHSQNSFKIQSEIHRNKGKMNTPNLYMTVHYPDLVQVFQ